VWWNNYTVNQRNIAQDGAAGDYWRPRFDAAFFQPIPLLLTQPQKFIECIDGGSAV
jgi:hypothetical protein